ncbi:hypothetical protein SISSUDRAFT_50964 [Sistotremastrum suecicum HHB10207 ss-3]|uniref:Hemerythrin-like domain-containing protein n=1 Tax=Sistotremastrum suecicum HHB10207 ss-3 TaxID=1314776 RepID=A0A166HBB1_9AGAM|nr:hypothetical protein SISSUDRAFT_50964 [Sistotremastrum suecicum HHB10207 ss-3]
MNQFHSHFQQSTEDRRWNRLAITMDSFHQGFRHEYDTIFSMADGSFSNKYRLSLAEFLRTATSFRRHLEIHHNIEERYIFPVLAKRMPSFRDNEKHRNSHHSIHDGLDRLSLLIAKYSEDNTKYSPTEFRSCLESFRDVLFAHLDEEVADLSGENLKKYWTIDEVDLIVI